MRTVNRVSWKGGKEIKEVDGKNYYAYLELCTLGPLLYLS